MMFPGDDDCSWDQSPEMLASSLLRGTEEGHKRTHFFQHEKQELLDQEVLDFHSLDLTKDTTDITSDFLTLPSKLSGRSSPSVLHRLHQFLNPDSRLAHQSSPDQKCRHRSNSDSALENPSGNSSGLEHRYSYDSKLDCYICSSQDPTWMFRDCTVKSLNPFGNSRCANSAENLPEVSNVDLPRIEFSDVSIVIDNLDLDDQNTKEPMSNIPDIFVGNNDQDQDLNLSTQGDWIGLHTQKKTLLSPRSSNGSICSFRSSNADSAIEMLTPEEEMSDMHDFSCQQETWDSDLIESKSGGSLSQSQDFNFDKCLLQSQDFNFKRSFSQSQDFNFETSLSQSEDFNFEKSELGEVWRQVILHKSSQPKYNEQSQLLDSFSATETLDQTNIVKQPPSVVVSDYSTSTREDKGSQTDGDGDLQDQLDIMDKRYLSFNRSQSNSSISSTDTSLSLQSDSSQDVDDVQEPGANLRKKKVSFLLYFSRYSRTSIAQTPIACLHG